MRPDAAHPAHRPARPPLISGDSAPVGSVKGYTNALGKAMGATIPRYFNTLLLAESTGSGENVRRKIRTVPTGMIDLKSSAPFKLNREYDLSTGLATVFEKLKETD